MSQCRGRRILAWMASFALAGGDRLSAESKIYELLELLDAERGFGGMRS